MSQTFVSVMPSMCILWYRSVTVKTLFLLQFADFCVFFFNRCSISTIFSRISSVYSMLHACLRIFS